jgi:uncharacterized membrane protein YdjX (TVP38/TMEM64 family)
MRAKRKPRGVAAKPSPAAKRTHASLLPAIPWKRLLVVAVLVAGAVWWFYRYGDVAAVHRTAARLNGGVAFALLCILPLLGFPASLLHVAAGIRFGVPLGLTLVSLSIGCQLLASYGLVHLWRRRFSESPWLQRIRRRIPRGAHASVCVFTVLLPGAPFTAINYVLPLVGVRLRTLLICAWPLHTLRATVTVAFGDQSDHLSAARLAGLLLYAAAILGASAWTYRRVRSQLEDQPSAGDGRRQPA